MQCYLGFNGSMKLNVSEIQIWILNYLKKTFKFFLKTKEISYCVTLIKINTLRFILEDNKANKEDIKL